MLGLPDISTLFIILGILVAAVNIVTEVLKQVLWNKVPTPLLVLIISVVLTMISMVVYCAVKQLALSWYYIAASFVVSFLVAYGAMFGFDKLQEILSKFTALSKK